jgi:hypothetical protein
MRSLRRSRLWRSLSAFGAAALVSLPIALAGCAKAAADTATHGETAMTNQAATVSSYEAEAKRFKPEQGLAATNFNDVRLFIYEWFTHFEHAAPSSFYLGHLDEKNLYVAFPGQAPITSQAAFTQWYENLLAQTLWNFHDVGPVQIKRTAPQEFQISFVVNWYGEVKSTSEQAPGWKSRPDSFIYHHKLRQTWNVRAGDRFVIQRLVVTPGDTPSPISE